MLINAVSNCGPFGANMVIGFLLTPYLLTHLGKTNFGIWTLVAHLLGYYGLIRLGVGAGIMRYVPFYSGRDDDSSASEIVSTGLVMFLGIGLVIFAISMLIAEPVARFYKAGAELASLLRVMGLAAAIECPMRILDASIRAHEKWIVANFVSIVMAICRALGLAGCVYFGYGVVGMGYAILAVTIFSTVLMAVMFVRFCPGIHFKLGRFKLAHAKSLIRFGILSTVITVVSALRLQGHSLIIGKMISIEAVALYGVAGLLIRYVRQAVTAPSRVFLPRFAYLDGGNHHLEITSLFRNGTKVVTMFSAGMMLIIFVAGSRFIRLWVGEGFEAAYPALMILAAGYLVETSLTITGTLLAGTGRQGVQAVMASVEGFLSLGLSILLVWLTELGLAGVALGFAISVTLIRGIVCPWYICRLHRTSLLGYYVDCLLRPWLIMGLLVLLVHSTNIVNQVNDWPSLILFVSATGSVYCVFAYFIALDEKLRKKLHERITKTIEWMISLAASKVEQESVGDLSSDVTGENRP